MTTTKPITKNKEILLNAKAETKPPFVKSLIRSFAWILISCVLVVVLLEGIFAVAHVGEQEYLKIDPILGFVHLENKTVTFRSEGYSRSTINSAGFRDYEYPVVKPPGVIRIAVLGDSKTEAFQVPIDQTFPKLLEKRLNTIQPGKYQVLNFGVSGFSTGQEYLLYTQRIVSYSPDIVVLAYHIGDSDENCSADGALASMPRPYFAIDGHGYLTTDQSILQTWLKGERARVYAAFDQLRRRSRIWGVLANLELVLNGDKTFQNISKKIGKPFVQLNNLLVSFLPQANFGDPLIPVNAIDHDQNAEVSLLPPSLRADQTNGFSSTSFRATPPVRTPAAVAPVIATNEAQLYLKAGLAKWQVTAAIIRELNEACKRNHARLVVAGLPAPDNSIFYFKELQYLETQSQSEGFEFVNVNAVFPSLRPMQKSPLYFNFHFSPQGHQLVSDTLYGVLVNSNSYEH